MRHIIIGMIIGIIAGIIIGATVIRPEIGPHVSAPDLPVNPAEVKAASPPAETKVDLPIETEDILWRMTSAYSGLLPLLGELPAKLETTLKVLSSGTFKMTFHEPGTLVPPEDLFDAVRSGSIQAGFSSPAMWAGKTPALGLFTSVPFGPHAREYLAWFYQGGGREIFEEIYNRHNIHSLLCAATSQEASGWFNKSISSTADLTGLRMRITGLGAKVMEKLGVTTENLMNNDLIVAMQSGSIDAAEFSQPATDFSLGLHRVANTVYFPGWHQPATLYDLMINKDAWDDLSDTAKAQIETACGDNIRRGLTLGDARQFAALKQFTKLGIHMKTWPAEILAAFQNAWKQVLQEQIKKDKDFKRTWKSLQTFREEYAIWQELSAP